MPAEIKIDPILQTKPCRTCKQILHISNFHKNKTTKCGYHTACKICNSKHAKAWKASKSIEQIKQIHRRQKLNSYGLTEEQHEIILQRQNGVCAICKTFKLRANDAHLCIDHSHKTNKVRGLLCSNCNSAIGKLNDDINLLKNAIEYLESYNE